MPIYAYKILVAQDRKPLLYNVSRVLPKVEFWDAEKISLSMTTISLLDGFHCLIEAHI